MEFKLYSQRLEEKHGADNSDIFEYEHLPTELINQIKYLLARVIGEGSPCISNEYGEGTSSDFYESIATTIMEHHGLSRFIKGIRYHHNNQVQLEHIISFLNERNGNVIVLDALELLFQQIEHTLPAVIRFETSNPYNNQFPERTPPSNIIDQLNERLKQRHFGYRYEEGQLIRLDSEFIHSEATRPALTLLNTSLFEKAHSLFLEAHHKLLKGELADSLVSANKSFEATLRIIIKAKEWNDPNPPTASKLVDECLAKGLIPQYLKTEIDSFRGLFSQGVPAIRNYKAGHAELPDENGNNLNGELTTHLCQYALNLAASHIVFLIECYKDSEST